MRTLYEFIGRLILPGSLDVFPTHAIYSEWEWRVIRLADSMSRMITVMTQWAKKTLTNFEGLETLITTGNKRDGTH